MTTTWQVHYIDNYGVNTELEEDGYGKPFANIEEAREFAEDLLDKNEATEVDVVRVRIVHHVEVIEQISNK